MGLAFICPASDPGESQVSEPKRMRCDKSDRLTGVSISFKEETGVRSWFYIRFLLSRIPLKPRHHTKGNSRKLYWNYKKS